MQPVVPSLAMAVTIDPKPRIRLPLGDSPEPKFTRSRSWLPLAIMAWVGAVVVAHGMIYGWLPGYTNSARVPSAYDSTVTAPVEKIGAAVSSGVESTESVAPAALPSAAPRDPEQLPDCETAVRDKAAEGDIDESLPLDLSRSPFGALLESRNWAKACRTSHPRRIHLCVAVRDGELLGATVTTDPADSSVAKCVIRAIARLSLVPDSTLRKVHLTIDLPSDRSR